MRLLPQTGNDPGDLGTGVVAGHLLVRHRELVHHRVGLVPEGGDVLLEARFVDEPEDRVPAFLLRGRARIVGVAQVLLELRLLCLHLVVLGVEGVLHVAVELMHLHGLRRRAGDREVAHRRHLAVLVVQGGTGRSTSSVGGVVSFSCER